MKKLLNVKSILGLAIVSMILISCAHSDKVVTNSLIQKRKYNKGYFIDFKKNNKKGLAVKSDAEVKEKSVITEKETIRKKEVFASNKVVTVDNAVVVDESSQTTKETNTTVEENIVLSKKVQKVVNKVNKIVQKQNKKLEKKKKKSSKAGGDNQIVALLLVIFVGGLGLHRFYLGYIWQGVVQLLTLGGCGIWALIDLIRIITGDLGPKDGSYTTKL